MTSVSTMALGLFMEQANPASGPPPAGPSILLETAAFLLMEDGSSHLLLE